MSEEYFPPEIWYEILIRLPVKSLCRFTLVSRSWYTLITSQAFISSHLNHSQAAATATATATATAGGFLLRRYTEVDQQEHYTLHPDTLCNTQQFCLSTQRFKLPVKTQPGYFRIVGSCDGVLCLFDDIFRDMPMIILWNPSIERYVTLPSPSITPTRPSKSVLGFGCDLLRKDYKVVRIVYWADALFTGYDHPPEVHVYSLKQKVWRRIMSPNCQCDVMQFIWSHAFVNWTSHWIATKGNDQRCLVLSFDMAAEVFREILLPEVLANKLPENLAVNTCREFLAVVDHQFLFCSVWVMEEYGVSGRWTNLYRISGAYRVVGFKMNGGVLMIKGGGQLALYDLNTGLVVDLGLAGTPRSFHADQYVESLVLLEGKHDILELDLSQLVARGCQIEEVNGNDEV